MKDRHTNRKQIKKRIRRRMTGTGERPRLAVYRSLKHIYAQLVDDTTGRTLVASSTLSKEFRDELKASSSPPAETSKRVGLALAKKAHEHKIERAIFDRSGYRYHGKVRALADGAREGGLKF